MRTRHTFGPYSKASRGNGHPVMFGFRPAFHFDRHPEGGGYPIGFLERAYRLMGVTEPGAVLHLCSGSLRTGVTVDIRPEMNPMYVCDARHTPFPGESFRWILADPPYCTAYAKSLYGTDKDYPTPGELCVEASRLLKPGGLFGLLHFQVPMNRKPLRTRAVYGVTTGAGYAIRAFTILEKERTQELALGADKGSNNEQRRD